MKHAVSAEQVTKRLITRLTTMSKYDLKQMIDNPAGKYETALNRHAQNKLRAEVRKQLKSIGLNELGSSCVAGDGTVESDEAIDANKIPPSLLAQIGQALDLDFEDLTQTDTESIEQGKNVSKEETETRPQELRLVETAQLLAHQSPVTSQETVFDEPEMIVDSKESVERIPSPEPNLDSTTSTNEEYILGGDAEKKCEPMEPETSDRDSNQPQELEKEPVQEPAQDPPSGTPQPTCSHAARLQSLYAVTEQLQSIDAQTMDLYNRKTQIDAIIMQLNAERMDINQQLVKLHNTRGEQMNYVRITLLELGMSEGSDGVPPVFTNQIPLPSSIGPMNQVAILHPSDPGASVSVVTVPQQERTIRRITPIGNSVLMKIFQRRRAPSERSVEENPPVDFA
uniref:Uncharacterized protein n=1 Tax=Anopheles epiroticus TaxID=199890 RepID=A0A182PCN9_9DIPT